MYKSELPYNMFLKGHEAQYAIRYKRFKADGRYKMPTPNLVPNAKRRMRIEEFVDMLDTLTTTRSN